MVRRLVLPAVAACFLATAASIALAGDTLPISKTTIDGARLGLTAADYERFFGPAAEPVAVDGSTTRVDFPRRKAQVFFRAGKTGGRQIVTWNRAYRTEAGIGPCSDVGDLLRVYRGKLRMYWANGVVLGYGWGDVVFMVYKNSRVTLVSLGPGFERVWRASRAPSCIGKSDWTG